MEVAASWAQVVRSVLQAQEELAKGAVSPFALLCAADAKLRAHLDLICDLSFHGLLVAWVMEGVRERVSTHAVPTFWRQHSELDVSSDRQCQTTFFAAIDGLARCVATARALAHAPSTCRPRPIEPVSTVM